VALVATHRTRSERGRNSRPRTPTHPVKPGITSVTHTLPQVINHPQRVSSLELGRSYEDRPLMAYRVKGQARGLGLLSRYMI
jgi:hypothetical protein